MHDIKHPHSSLYCIGGCIGGEEGVCHVLYSVIGDLKLNLHLSRTKSMSLEHLNHSFLRRISLNRCLMFDYEVWGKELTRDLLISSHRA